MLNGWKGTVTAWDEGLGKGELKCQHETFKFNVDSLQLNSNKLTIGLLVIFNKSLMADHKKAINIRPMEKATHTAKKQPTPVHGIVTFYDPKKQFGFISYNATQYYVPKREIPKEKKQLQKGWQVVFVPGKNENGPIATSVRILQTSLQRHNCENRVFVKTNLISPVYTGRYSHDVGPTGFKR